MSKVIKFIFSFCIGRLYSRFLKGVERRGSRLIFFAAVFAAGVSQLAYGAALRTQVIELNKGWNAVWLTVDPQVHDPSLVFTNAPVDVVSSYEGTGFTKQFVSDSSVNMINTLGWATWYAPSREDSFLSNFGAMHGNAPYLVHAVAACTVTVTGEVICEPVLWKADGYNLVGFSLDTLAPPTFAQFFSGSAAHRSSSLYRLTGGVWKKVIDPANTAMRSGEAFWIYAQGASRYQGPLEVSAGAGGMVVVRPDDVYDVSVKNRTAYPLTATVRHVVAAGEKLPLSIVVSLIGDFWTGVHQVPSDLGNASWEIELPPLEGGTGFKIPLTVLADRLEAAEVGSLLCIKSDLGTETWIPVKASREDLK